MENKNPEKENGVEIIPNTEEGIDSIPETLDSTPTNNVLDTDTLGKTIEIKSDDIISEKIIKPAEIEKNEPFIIEPKSAQTPKIMDQNGDIIIKEEVSLNKEVEDSKKNQPVLEKNSLKKTPLEILKKHTSSVKKVAEDLINSKTSLKEGVVENKTTVPENKDLKKENTEDTNVKKLKPEKKDKKTLLKTVRTYQDDVVKIMKEQKTSLTKMVVAENKKQILSNKKTKKRSASTKKTVFSISILISIVIVIGLAGLYFLDENKETIAPTITELKIPTFIFPNYTREIFITRLKRDKIIEAFESEKKSISIPLGSIIQLYLTKEDQTKQFIVEKTKGNKLLLTTEVFFNTIGIKISSSLERALGSDFMFGYHSSLGNNPFLIFEVKLYNNAFSEMLKWEKTIFQDLSPTFIKEDSDIDITRSDFQDIVIINKDVRAILNDKGKIEFAYAFLNKETLVIINNETTFKELSRRIINTKLERKD